MTGVSGVSAFQPNSQSLTSFLTNQEGTQWPIVGSFKGNQLGYFFYQEHTILAGSRENLMSFCHSLSEDAHVVQNFNNFLSSLLRPISPPFVVAGGGVFWFGVHSVNITRQSCLLVGVMYSIKCYILNSSCEVRTR